MLLIGIFAGVGLIDEFEPDEYPRDWMMHRSEERFRTAVNERADSIDGSDLQPGDVALYKVGHCFAHGAVVIDWPVVIHADSRFGKVTLTEGNQGWLAGRDVEFYRVRGLLS
jgi:hypothetical protein